MPGKHGSSKQNRRASPRVGSGERTYVDRPFRGWATQQPHSSFADRALVSLDYWDSKRVNPGVVSWADSILLINSLFDPDFTGTGHQPREFDTWATLYSKYRVLRVKAEVQVRQRAAHGLWSALIANNSSTALSANDAPLELPRAVIGLVTGSSQPVASFNVNIDPRAVLGMTSAEFRGDDATAALVTASPAQAVYLHIVAGALDGSTPADYEITYRLRMECEFYDRKVLGISSLVSQIHALEAQAAAAAPPGGAGVLVDGPTIGRTAPTPATAGRMARRVG